MPIKIYVIERRNPLDPEAPSKFYASTKNQGDVSLNTLSKQIALMSTVSKTDVYAVLMALTEVVPSILEEGKIVRLGSLGSFRLTVSSEASLTAEEVSTHNVKQIKLRFSPSHELKKEVEGFPLEKA